jgi:hypothetical protein
MSGLVVTPREEDFKVLDGDAIEAIIAEVGISEDTADEIAKRLKD